MINLSIFCRCAAFSVLCICSRIERKTFIFVLLGTGKKLAIQYNPVLNYPSLLTGKMRTAGSILFIFLSWIACDTNSIKGGTKELACMCTCSHVAQLICGCGIYRGCGGVGTRQVTRKWTCVIRYRSLITCQQQPHPFWTTSFIKARTLFFSKRTEVGGGEKRDSWDTLGVSNSALGVVLCTGL